MALVIADRVRETTVTSGTADIALGGAVTGFQSFAVIGNNNTTYYCVAGQGTNEWEVGIGTYISSTNTLERTTVLSNSSGTAPSKINFLAGTKDIFVTYPASKSVDTDTAQTLTNKTLGSGTVISTDQPTVISANSASAALRITQTGAGNALLVEDSANPDASPFVVNADGNIIQGATSFTLGGAIAPWFAMVGSNAFGPQFILENKVADSNGSYAVLRKGRNGAIVNSGDTLGTLTYQGFDGVFSINAAQIAAQVDGTPGTNDMPGRLVFSTTADGASTPTERMRIDSVGNVGIGTASPGAILDVRDNANGANFLVGGSGTLNVTKIGSGAADALALYTNTSTEVMRLGTDGNVGIGTTLPGYRLDVQGSGSTIRTLATSGTPVVLIESVQAAGFAPSIFAARRLGAGGTGTPSTSTVGALRFDGYSSTGGYTVFGAINCDIGTNTTTGAPGSLTFLTSSDAATATERMRIDSAGNVGLGTSAPAAKLDILNDSASHALLRLYQNNASYNTDLYFVNIANTTSNTLISKRTTGDLWLFHSGANDIAFYTNATERMRIDSNGNVGLGTAGSALSRFNVAGTFTQSTGNTQAIRVSGTVPSTATASYYGVTHTLTTTAAAFTLPAAGHFTADQGTIGAGSTVTNQYGYIAGSSLTGATNNYGFFSNIASGTGRWNFYAAGTAANYFAGDLRLADGFTTGSGTGGKIVGLYGNTPRNEIFSNNVQALSIFRFGNDVFGADIHLLKTRNAAYNGQTIVQNNDQLGNVVWGASDGVGYINAASIAAQVDGTPGTNDMPGRIVFNTTPDGSTTLTERMRIDSAGQVGIGGASAAGRTIDISKVITGSTSSYGVNQRGQVQTDVTSDAVGFRNVSNTITGFTLPSYQHFLAAQGTLSGAVTAQYGFAAESTLTGATNNYGFFSNIASGTGRWNFYAAGTAANYFAGSVGIGDAGLTGYNLLVSKNITGATTAFGIGDFGIIQSDVTSEGRYLAITTSTAAAAFTVANVRGAAVFQGSFGAGSTVTNQTAFHAGANLTGATNNYGFYSDIPSGTGRWNFFANGTANNYFAGATQIANTLDVTTVTAVGFGLRVKADSANARSIIQFTNNAASAQWARITSPAANVITFDDGGSVEKMRIDSSGNVGIGTSSPGHKLQVSGGISATNGTNEVLLNGNDGNIELIRSSSDAFIDFKTSAAEDFDARIQQRSNGLAFDTGGNGTTAERMRIDSGGNINIATAGARITGDFSNATVVSRVAFQTSTANTGTTIVAIPNGTAGGAFWDACGASDPTNASVGKFGLAANTEVTVRADRYGTGTYLPMTFYTGGSERVRIDTSGNLLVGTTVYVAGGFGASSSGLNINTAQPQMLLRHSGTGETAYLGIASNAVYFQTENAIPIRFGTNNTERMRIDASGNVGIGTNTPGYRLDVQAANPTNGHVALFRNSTASGNGAQIVFDLNNVGGAAVGIPNNTNALAFYVNSSTTERMRIDSSGNLLVGTTNSSITAGTGFKIIDGGQSPSVVSPYSTNANSSYFMYSTGAGAYRFYVRWDGVIQATSTTITGISDQRLKENVQDLDEGLAKIMALKPRRFDWKSGKGRNVKGDRGWIAQEFEQVFPDMIDESLDPVPEGEEPYKTVRADLLPVLVKAIQEQQQMINELRNEIAALKGA